MFVNPPELVDQTTEALAKSVIGAAIEVHRQLGPGFGEAVYEEALCIELELRAIPFARQVPVTIIYKGRCAGMGRMDLLVGGTLIVELKVVNSIEPIHTAQALSYLKVTRNRLALVINFNVPILKQGIRRVIL